MRLVLRLGAAFAFLTAMSTAALGFELRDQLRKDESDRFQDDVKAACDSVNQEVRRQAESDHKLVAAACQSGELVDRTLTWIENGEIDGQRMSIGSTLVPNAKAAFGLDELLLVTEKGEILGADPRDLLGTPRAEVDLAMKPGPKNFALRLASADLPLAIVSRCRSARGGRSVALIGARRLVPLLGHLADTLKVGVAVGSTIIPSAQSAQTVCSFSDGESSVPILVTKSKAQLYRTWAYIDRAILFAAAASTLIALFLASWLARSLSRPIVELAAEARKVATDQANPLRVRGSGEIAELVRAFDKMIEDLAATRTRLAAASRVAAWREVARRVAHEVKNPLAPIRAAVETLRRLRARQDPAFDEYFDEATRTVLDEVHRISNIVTEFTRFARLPPPRPEDVELVELARHVVQLQQANAGASRVVLESPDGEATVRADRDQIIQVVTNLVQNAVEAVGGKAEGRVRVVVQRRGDAAELLVRDNGPGIASNMTSRLFEPYATTKAEGTGLGLAIAQRIAMEHGGELSSLAGDAGEGAVFRLVLPVRGPLPVADAPPASS